MSAWIEGCYFSRAKGPIFSWQHLDGIDSPRLRIGAVSVNPKDWIIKVYGLSQVYNCWRSARPQAKLEKIIVIFTDNSFLKDFLFSFFLNPQLHFNLFHSQNFHHHKSTAEKLILHLPQLTLFCCWQFLEVQPLRLYFCKKKQKPLVFKPNSLH